MCCPSFEGPNLKKIKPCEIKTDETINQNLKDEVNGKARLNYR
ncbi:hypothetical protein M899_1802 [Bacteriovorax sp. BSW11_IV]|nr:hypothetical protein M899_1802 [Bacteriovorax sp. BSW11_IV]